MNNFKTVEKLVSDNIKLTYFHIKHARDLDQSDALSAAMDGLQRAAEQFDVKEKIPFGTFASLHIKWRLGNLRKSLRAEKRGKGIHKISLDAPISENGSESFSEIVADDKAINTVDQACINDNKNILMKYFYVLNHRQQEILSLYFGFNGYKEPITLEQIAAKLKISGQRVRQIKEQSFKKLREKLVKYKYKQQFNEENE